MKRKIVLILLITLIGATLVFSENSTLYYRATQDTPYFIDDYDKELSTENVSGILKIGQAIKLYQYNKRSLFRTDTINENKDFIGRFLIDNEDHRVIIKINDLIPFETEDFFSNTILSKFENPSSRYYLMDYTASVLYSKNRNTLLEHEPFWEDPDNPLLVDEFFDLTPWHEVYARELYDGYPVLILTNIFMQFFGSTLAFKNIDAIENGYRITAKFMTDNWEYGYPVPFDFTPVENDVFFDILLQFDGDYLDVILAKNNKKLATAIAVNKEFIDQYRNLIAKSTCDLSNITWPRHADGTSDFNKQNSVNVKVGVLYSTTDNLRLRSAEDTTSDILTTLEKGTRVIVKDLGKQQTIDGITANWVKVELEDGTEGWCFGGYLVEVPVEMKVPSPAHTEEVKDTTPAENDEKDIPDETSGDITTSPFPLLPVAGGAVLVIVIALVVVIAKRRKR